MAVMPPFYLRFKSVSGPFQVRFKSFARMGLTWELHRSYLGTARLLNFFISSFMRKKDIILKEFYINVTNFLQLCTRKLKMGTAL